MDNTTIPYVVDSTTGSIWYNTPTASDTITVGNPTFTTPITWDQRVSTGTSITFSDTNKWTWSTPTRYQHTEGYRTYEYVKEPWKQRDMVKLYFLAHSPYIGMEITVNFESKLRAKIIRKLLKKGIISEILIEKNV